MEYRYITRAEAERLRSTYVAAFNPPFNGKMVNLIDELRADGFEYYIVTDDDPRAMTYARS